MTTVAVVTNMLPHYRASFYRELFNVDGFEVTVFCQSKLMGTNLKTAHEQFPSHVQLISYHGLARERFGWQSLPWKSLLTRFDVLFILGNPRIVSNVLLSIAAKLVGRKVVIWGQAHTAGANSVFEMIRLRWWRMFCSVFVYTDAEAESLRRRGFSKHHVVGMNNGLDQDNIERATARWPPSKILAWRSRGGLSDKVILLSCARLEAKNKFDVVLPAIRALRERVPNILWCVIGTGSEAEKLRDQARALAIDDSIRWLGEVHEENDLAPWFLSSKYMVHPAGVGLSLLHAYGYGLPIILNEDMSTHMPEVAAFIESQAGITFNLNSAKSLEDALAAAISNDQTRYLRSMRAIGIVRDKYNTKTMVARFLSMASVK
jgi:glycosyltransferase involved in cell wall biosynthesis